MERIITMIRCAHNTTKVFHARADGCYYDDSDGRADDDEHDDHSGYEDDEV